MAHIVTRYDSRLALDKILFCLKSNAYQREHLRLDSLQPQSSLEFVSFFSIGSLTQPASPRTRGDAIENRENRRKAEKRPSSACLTCGVVVLCTRKRGSLESRARALTKGYLSPVSSQVSPRFVGILAVISASYSVRCFLPSIFVKKEVAKRKALQFELRLWACTACIIHVHPYFLFLFHMAALWQHCEL